MDSIFLISLIDIFFINLIDISYESARLDKRIKQKKKKKKKKFRLFSKINTIFKNFVWSMRIKNGYDFQIIKTTTVVNE